MRTQRILGAAVLGLALAVGGAAAGGAIKSGPQVGERIPGPFHPTNVTGAQAGKKHCLVCENGTNPVAMVFAREVTPELTQLIKKLDAATAANKGKMMGSFVVFLTDNEGLGKDLTTMAEKEGLKNIVLSIDNPAGPKGYEVARDASVTVVLYNEQKVAANHTFRKGDLNAKAIDTVVSDVSKIVK